VIERLLPEVSDLDEVDRLVYFEAVSAGFARAVQKTGNVVERFYTIGKFTVCLRFADDALISQLTPALAHLATEPIPFPALTICAWDSASTKTQLPLLITLLVDALHRNQWEYLGPRREIKHYHSQRLHTTFVWPGILSVLDTKRALAFYWIDDAAQIPHWERGAPFLSILSRWLETVNYHYLHAGAVGNRTGGVLLAGKGGSGKSTTALACLQSELLYASDDYCLVTDNPSPYVYSLYNTAKLKGQRDFLRFPHLSEKTSNTDRLQEEKAVIFLHQHYPEKLIAGFPIRAILVPTITEHKETQLQPTTSIHALKALAPSTMFQLPGAGQRRFQTIVRLIKSVPCFTLKLGSDIAAIPPVIARFLSQA
jgi:hypothetical protein